MLRNWNQHLPKWHRKADAELETAFAEEVPGKINGCAFEPGIFPWRGHHKADAELE